MNFQRGLVDFFDTARESIQVIERFSKHVEFLPYAEALEEWDEIIGEKWVMPENKYLNISWFLEGNQTFRTFTSKLSSLFEVSFVRINAFLKNFNYYLNFYWRDINTDFSVLANDRLMKQSLVYETILKLYRELVRIFEEGIAESADLGVFRVNLMPVKKIIGPMPKERLKSIEEKLPNIMRKRIADLTRWLNESVRRLSSMVTDIAEFIEQKKHFVQISIEYEDRKVSVEQVTEMFELLQNNEIPMNNNDRDGFLQMQSAINQLTNTLHNVELSANKNNDRFTKTLDEMIEKLHGEINAFMEKATDDNLIQHTENVEERLAELDALERQVSEIEGTKDEYKKYEEVLQVNEYSDFNNVEKLKNEVGLRILLWRTRYEWAQVSEEWAALPFSLINPKELGQKADQFTKKVYRVEKNLPESPIIEELKKSVHNFREAMPVVTALRSQYLKEVHWDEIKRVLKSNFNIKDPNLTPGEPPEHERGRLPGGYHQYSDAGWLRRMPWKANWAISRRNGEPRMS